MYEYYRERFHVNQLWELRVKSCSWMKVNFWRKKGKNLQSVALSTQKRGIIALPAFEVCINVIFFHANRTIENNALDAFYFFSWPTCRKHCNAICQWQRGTWQDCQGMDQEICDMIKYKIIFINTILMPCFRFIKKADVAK